MSANTSNIFDLAPIAMWIEDFSGVKAQFDRWRADGVNDIRAFLKADQSRVAACSSAIRVVEVNHKTLELFEANNLEHLVANLSDVFRDEMLEHHISELAALWDGDSGFVSNAVNYSLSGRRMDIQLKGLVMPGHEETLGRVLLTTEDMTAREDARRNETTSRQYAEGLFAKSPVSLWVEDFRGIKALMDHVRARGIEDFRTFMDVHPEFVRQCMSEIRVVDVNGATLELFGAPDLHTLLKRQNEIFRGEMEKPFREQLMDLWDGKLSHSREVINYALDGSIRHILLHFAVLPGFEHNWGLVQVALTDITARKKAEAYLEYLGKHDVLTKLYNRAFYTEELNRLERKPLRPVSIIIMDLNGLKQANDTLGHDAGDALLRRFGEVLSGVVSEPYHAARTGGDEFAILMPGADAKSATSMVETIGKLLVINNQFYSSAPLSVSVGQATSRTGENIEEVIKRADSRMYEAKRAHHAGLAYCSAKSNEKNRKTSVA